MFQVEEAVEVYHDEPFKNRRWSFPSHNFTVSVVWSPFLTKAFTFENDDGISSDITQLYLDEPDTIWTYQYEDFDYVVIGGGKWFLKAAIYYEKETIWGCHNCHDNNITEIGFEHAYQKALNSTFKFITEAKHKPHIFFRTTTPDHFENGEWDSGGYCNRTKPFKADEIVLRDIDEIMRYVELEEFESAAEVVSRNGASFKLFDTTLLSLLRPDGHPGIYRQFQPYAGKDEHAKIQNDCLHWCLPGPIDSWNDLMMEMLLRHERQCLHQPVLYLLACCSLFSGLFLNFFLYSMGEMGRRIGLLVEVRLRNKAQRIQIRKLSFITNKISLFNIAFLTKRVCNTAEEKDPSVKPRQWLQCILLASTWLKVAALASFHLPCVTNPA